MAPLEAQANQIAASLRQRGIIQHSDPEIAQRIEQAVAEAIKYYPYGATAEEINQFIIARTGKDFAEHFNKTWGNQVGVDYYQVMAAALAKSPKDVFEHVIDIHQSDAEGGGTFWRNSGDSGIIGIDKSEFDPTAYDRPSVGLIKEASGSKAYVKAYDLAKNIKPFIEKGSVLGGRIGEATSFALQARAYLNYPEELLISFHPKTIWRQMGQSTENSSEMSLRG